MRWWRELTFILDRLIHRRRAERELDEEISVHRELEIEENIASGMSPEEARNAANRSFGSVALSKELSRNAWGLRWLEMLWQDLRYGLRMLIKSPGFCAVAVISLGLGIGVNAAVFSLVNAAFLKTLPVDNPKGLVYVIENMRSAPASYLNYRDYCELNRSFSGLAAYSNAQPVALTEQGQVQMINAEVVSGNYFSVLAIQPAMGRAFIEGEDDRLGAEPTVMLSHAFWRRRFNSDPGLIGKQISLKENKVTVIGILPERFPGIMPAMPANIWVTIPTFAHVENSTGRINRGHSWLSMIGRLKPGVSIEQARSEMEIVVNNVRQANSTDTNSPRKLVKVTLSPVDQLNPAKLKGKGAPGFILILGAAFLVLLIACINIASLTLARASARQKEIAIRLALGAGRRRLVVQLLAENIILALFCGSVGLILSYWASDLSRSFVPARFANFIPALNIDLNVTAYTIGLSLVTGILFGLVPALRVSKPHLTQVLTGNIGLGREGRRGWNLRNVMIIFQVAVSFVMLIAAGLFVRAWEREKATGATLNTGNILITSGDFGNNTSLDQAFYRDLVSRIEAIPGVQSAIFSHKYPITDDFTNTYREGEDNVQWVSQNMVSHGYFQTMKIPVVHGRDFTGRDDVSSPNVIIVNETAARILWPGQEALGKLLRIGGPDEPSREVVGVVKDVRYKLYGKEIPPQVFVPLNQRFRPNLTLIVRASSDNPKLLIEPIRREIKSMNNGAPVFLDFQTHDELVSLFLLPMRAGSILLSIFGALVLLVSTIGLYGLTAYTVIIRTREIGIRTALGAQRKEIIRLMVKEAAIISFVGIVIGLAIAVAVTRLLSSLLYGISSTDPLTYAAVSVFVALVVVSAFYLPARRATKINPLDALRYE
jgi:macrolide transport system ATP-binding/permease protein